MTLRWPGELKAQVLAIQGERGGSINDNLLYVLRRGIQAHLREDDHPQKLEHYALRTEAAAVDALAILRLLVPGLDLELTNDVLDQERKLVLRELAALRPSKRRT